jgi:hypothetical protein
VHHYPVIYEQILNENIGLYKTACKEAFPNGLEGGWLESSVQASVENTWNLKKGFLL